MKIFYIILTLFVLSNCSNQKKVFWCGDHACSNKKEKEAYFKKTMIVELKVLNKSEKKKDNNLTDEILLRDKKYKKKNKKDSKKTSQDIIFNKEKLLDEQIKIDEKKRIDEEELIKQILIEEKKLQEQEKLSKKILLNDKKKIKVTSNQSDTNLVKSDQNLLTNSVSINRNSNDEFDALIKKITEKNLIKPFPNINDIPK